jgi:hypothetical protein
MRLLQFFMPAMTLTSLCFFSSPSSCLAQEAPFRLTTDLTYASSYITDGFSIGGDGPVIQLSAQLKNQPTGLSLLFWSSLQTDPAAQPFNELDFFLHFERDLFKGKIYEVNIHGFYDYWVYPNRMSSWDWYGNPIQLPTKQGNKLQGGIALTNLIPFFGSHLIPVYNLYYWLYWNQNMESQFQGGARHEILLRTSHLLPEWIPALHWPHVELASSLNYHTGAFGVLPGFSHTTAHLKVGAFALGFLLSIGLHHQWSYEKSVNPLDRTWSSFSLTKSI